MNRLYLILSISFVLAAGSLSAQTAAPAGTRIVSPTMVHKMERQITGLYKHVERGLLKHLISQEKSEELNAEVKSLEDKKDQFLWQTGDHRLTIAQMKELDAQWKAIMKQIQFAKFPNGHPTRAVFRATVTPALH